MIESEDAARDWLRGLPECDAAAMERLAILIDMLTEENQRQNLVSAASLGEVWRRHITDSAQLLAYVPRGTSPWLDLGTGAGFPGLVVAALRPEIEVVMVESRARRSEWLTRVITALRLERAAVVSARLEQVPSRHFAAISARAFAPLPKLLELATRFANDDTLWLLPKGRSAKRELEEIADYPHMFHVEQSVTDADSGIIVGKLQGLKGTRK